ncbi:CNPV086 TNFR-like protein [Canarypox virus]|uniref:CNPV086 TNFR-like protein n=1 Tax=Canarypox virus TaxID=44088 RepID=Q6VZR1_CNPV|nr:CNPV086 TNFR-like protein [Canarypox virus]AAR83432.1 CNPV086 TNFR-like protein [Canarypox virus]AWD84562.1 TNFR-like protein [Canarypox virus]
MHYKNKMSVNILIITVLIGISFQASTYRSKINSSLICDMCPPGYYKNKDCTSTSTTICLPCGEGEYTAYNNSLTKCIRCKDCYEENEKIFKPCNSTSDTICTCIDGYTKDETTDSCI